MLLNATGTYYFLVPPFNAMNNNKKSRKGKWEILNLIHFIWQYGDIIPILFQLNDMTLI